MSRNRFTLYSRLKNADRDERTEFPTKHEIAEFVSRMRKEDDLFHLAAGERSRPRQDDQRQEYETSLTMAHRQIKFLEEALHNEKLVSESLRRKLAIYESNLPSVPAPLFADGHGRGQGLVGLSTARPSGSVTEWRVRLDEVQKSQLDRLTARR